MRGTTAGSWLAAIAMALVLAACSGTGVNPRPADPIAYAAGPAGVESSSPGRKQLWFVPSTVSGLLMRANVYRPTGNGPFPLAIVTHGSDQEASARQRMGMPDFPDLTDWLLKRGYAVVLLQRPGHGETGGPYLEDQGSCSGADYLKSGRQTAISLEAALRYFDGQPFVRAGNAVLIGNSAGGWGAIAAGSDSVRGLAKVVNFSGGRGGHNRGRPGNNCAPERLVDAAAIYGASSRVPTLWLYAQNDTYFAPDLSRRMYDSFAGAGGKGNYLLLPPVGTEGHRLIESEATWATSLAAFLK